MSFLCRAKEYLTYLSSFLKLNLIYDILKNGVFKL